MANKFDTKAFHNSLAHDVGFHAGRLNLDSKSDYAHAAAVLMSIVQTLANHSVAKPLNQKDFAVAIGAALEQLNVEVVRTPVGGIEYKYKQK